VKTRGFTLLEVLVAIAILGLGLTAILSSQVGLFSSASRSQNLTIATNLARCKMNEVELELLTEGFPAIDSDDSGECCAEKDDDRFRCEWKVQRVELPDVSSVGSLGDGGLSADMGSLGPLGVLAEAQASGGESLGESADIGTLAEAMGSSAGGGVEGIAGMLFGMVYPDLKPMLEASIRKATVWVKWKEGSNERDLSVTQYVSDPQQGGLESDAGVVDPNSVGAGNPLLGGAGP
jgi:general secretion pathway protein I